MSTLFMWTSVAIHPVRRWACALACLAAAAAGAAEPTAPPPQTAPADPWQQAAARVAGWSWRGVSDALVLNQAVVLFGMDERTNKPTARRLDWSGGGQLTDTSLEGLPLSADWRYTSDANSAGLWLAGPGLALLTPSGKLLRAPAGAVNADRPPLVALPDGSALLFKTQENDLAGQGRIERARIAPDGQSLVLTPLAPLSYDGAPHQPGKPNRTPLYGHGAQLLADGRVLMFGDERTPNLASIFDPATGRMQPVADMPNARALAAHTRLADGRVVVAGAVAGRCYDAAARLVDLYDVPTNRWATLPPLPMPLCASAYGAWHPAVVQASNGSLVLGGGLERELLVLERDRSGPHGFAPHWKRVGLLPTPRIGGQLQALPGARVAVIGGVHTPLDSGSCCSRTAGIDLVSLDAAEPSFAPGGLTLNGPGVAQRGRLVFIAGGRRFLTTGTGQMRYASHAELLDLRTGARTQLPTMPLVAGALDAYWVDDDRVVVKGMLAASDRGFDGDLASYMPSGSAQMAVFSRAANRWQLLDVPELESGRLVGVVRQPGRAEPVVVVDHPSGPWLLALPPGLAAPRAPERWPGDMDAAGGKGAVRLLADGRLVRSGETAASDLISVLDPRCESQRGARCKEEFVEIGPIKPANTLQMVSLLSPRSPPLRDVGPPPDGLVRNAVTPAGDVLRLVWEQPKDEAAAAKPGVAKGWVIKRWRAGRSPAWETLPTPRHWTRAPEGLGARECGPGGPGYDAGAVTCQLLALDDPREGATAPLLLLRATVADRDYAWHTIDVAGNANTTTVHWWDESGQRWTEVLRVQGSAARAVPQTLKNLPGKPLHSLGWHLSTPILWVD